MGEWSKLLGEKGEKISKFVLEEILGINSLEENKNLPCSKSTKHQRKESKSARTTHGIDGLYYMNSPLEDELLDIAIISTKFSNEYPKSPRSKFITHLEDLAQTLECFQFSEDNSRISQLFNDVTKTNYTGILIWLSNADPINFDFISHLYKTQIPSDFEFEKIIILDNARVNFLYEAIYKTKKVRSNVEFVYHDTSLNRGNLNSKSYGSTFPINYLYSDIIILRSEEKGFVEFLIFINAEFDSNGFAQILAFSKSFDYLNAVNKTIIHFLKYDSIANENQVKSTLINYSNFKLNENLFISIFPLDYRQ